MKCLLYILKIFLNQKKKKEQELKYSFSPIRICDGNGFKETERILTERDECYKHCTYGVPIYFKKDNLKYDFYFFHFFINF